MRLEDYPESTWRPNQKDGAHMMLAVALENGPRRVGIEGPCGSGKSHMYLRALLDDRCPPSVVMTTTRQHLTQIEETLKRDFPGESWEVLRGRDHYGCCKSPRPAPGEDTVDAKEVWATAGAPGQCPLGLDCRYRAAVIRAGLARMTIQCTIGALYRRRFWSQLELAEDPTPAQRELHEARQAILNRSVAVLDEAHEYLRVRREFETERLAIWPAAFRPELQTALQKARVKWGGYKSNAVLLKRNHGLGLAIECEYRDMLKPENLERAVDQAERAAKKSGKAFNRTAHQLMIEKQCNDRIALLQKFATDKDGSPTPKYDPVVYVEFDGLKCRLVSEPLYINDRDKFAAKEVFTSATLAGVAGLLGIDTKQWLHCFPPVFSPEAIDPMPLDDNADGTQKNVPLGADQLTELYESEGRPLTIALYLSKNAAHAAAGGIARQPGVFVQGWRGEQDEEMALGEMVSQVKAAAARGETPFLVCYGGWVGTDIPGEKWLVIGQAPKTPLAPYIEERQNRKLGAGWNDYEKVTLDRLQLAQGLGRALRSAEDRAVVIWPNNSAFRQLGLDPATGQLR